MYLILTLLISAGFITYHKRHQILKSRLFIKLLTKLLTRGETSTFVEGDGEFGMIIYKRRGKQYQVNVPYSRRLIRKTSGKIVYLLRGGTKINVTHQPGIKYLLTPMQMGGEKFIIEDENGEYECNDIPFM
jgi:hypothetical protein